MVERTEASPDESKPTSVERGIGSVSGAEVPVSDVAPSAGEVLTADGEPSGASLGALITTKNRLL